MFDYMLGIIIFCILAILFNAIKVLREYERGVIFQLGRFWKVKGPGLIIVIPVVQQMVRVDLRVIVMDVPTQDVISRDNVSVKVNAVVYFRVIDPDKAIDELNASVPLGRIAEPEDIADVVAFLASDQARYMCGALVEVNGGKPVG